MRQNSITTKIRQQKKRHWNEFLADNDNIWKAAKYLKSGNESAFGTVPQLIETEGTVTADRKEQAEELLSKFFPSLPSDIDDEGPRPRRAFIESPAITMEEAEQQLLATKSWKASEEDCLPVIMWKEIWPAVKYHVLALFSSLSGRRDPDPAICGYRVIIGCSIQKRRRGL